MPQSYVFDGYWPCKLNFSLQKRLHSNSHVQADLGAHLKAVRYPPPLPPLPLAQPFLMGSTWFLIALCFLFLLYLVNMFPDL